MRENEIFDLNRFEGEIYIILFKKFESNTIVDLRINFVKVKE